MRRNVVFSMPLVLGSLWTSIALAHPPGRSATRQPQISQRALRLSSEPRDSEAAFETAQALASTSRIEQNPAQLQRLRANRYRALETAASRDGFASGRSERFLEARAREREQLAAAREEEAQSARELGDSGLARELSDAAARLYRSAAADGVRARSFGDAAASYARSSTLERVLQPGAPSHSETLARHFERLSQLGDPYRSNFLPRALAARTELMTRTRSAIRSAEALGEHAAAAELNVQLAELSAASHDRRGEIAAYRAALRHFAEEGNTLRARLISERLVAFAASR